MKTGVKHITIEQGATFRLSLSLERAGVPWNLTGYTHTSKIYQGDTAIANITVTVVNASGGLVDLEVSASTASSLKAGAKYSWRYYATTGTTVYNVLGGDVIVIAGMP